MKLNDEIVVTIIDDNHNGNGICKENDFPIFIPRTVKGDIVKIKITGINRKYALGEVISYIKRSNDIEKVKCPYYENCGGCRLLHVSFDRENELKKKYISRLFNDYPCKINFFDRYGYRNKVTLHVKDKKLGFYKEKTNELIEVSNCLLLDDEINELISFLKNIDLSLVEEVVIKKGTYGLLLSVKGSINNKDILSLIKYPRLISIYQNDKLIYGEEYIVNEFGGIKYNINQNCFFQVNNKCASFLYDKVKEYVINSDKLLDLYCGTGSIGIYLSDICKEVVGIEINKDSVRCFRKNIKDNNISNYRIIKGDASLLEKDNYDVIVVDPPRSGLDKKVIAMLNEIKCKKLIYISCNPSTLKRDISLLEEYKLKFLEAFNMFPGTKHVECVSVLHLKSLENKGFRKDIK
ncbi:MAG: class I SAM-dependent RNA methyltransferase [Bacilli bacterium]